MGMRRARKAYSVLAQIFTFAFFLQIGSGTARAQQQKPAPLAYDEAHEITIKGSIQAVLTQQEQGKFLGAHLLVNTVTGLVDVHFGPAPQKGALASLGLAPGEAVEIVGAFTTNGGESVLLARTVKTGNRLLVLRSQHGIPLASAGSRASFALRAVREGRQ